MKTRKRADTALSRLKVGAWYNMAYGFERKDFCVIAINDEDIVLESPWYSLSDSLIIDVQKMFSRGSYYDPKFLGYGKPRWFWGRIRRWTDCIGTLYTRP